MSADEKSWLECDPEDRWVFDKLLLSSALGYECGPAGVSVPRPAHYIVRPCVNIEGMGRGAHFLYLTGDTSDLPAGTFWCEKFEGEHLSVDYKDGEQVLVVRAEVNPQSIIRFKRWERVQYTVALPDIVQKLVDKYPSVNVELIDNKVIEVHLRDNPNFADGATEIIPVWHDQTPNPPEGYVYVEDKEYLRRGFYKRY